MMSMSSWSSMLLQQYLLLYPQVFCTMNVEFLFKLPLLINEILTRISKVVNVSSQINEKISFLLCIVLKKFNLLYYKPSFMQAKRLLHNY